MSKKAWWTDPEYFIRDLESEEWGVTHLMGREIDGQWEYAIVFWRHRSPTLEALFKNGKMID